MANVTEFGTSPPGKARTLIFPAGMPRSLRFLEQALSEGRDVIGASSLGYDPARERYPSWTFLPYVSEPHFIDALQRAITEFGIREIYTPNPVVWHLLSTLPPTTLAGAKLLNSSPVDEVLAAYRSALGFAQQTLAEPMALAANGASRNTLDQLNVAALFRHTETIPGMCDHEKLRALIEIGRHCCDGDVVEIGSWWGKSAFVLLQLGRLYGIGKLLCIDPWANEHLLQQDNQGLVDSIPIDANEALTVFQLNLLPYAAGAMNYLRLPSVLAAECYQADNAIASPEFGTSHYRGRIGLLHIDGNHNYDHVKADLSAWANKVSPGGWIVLDDYRWPYGDGPMRASDEFVLRYRDQIETCFVCGNAMFIRLQQAI